MINNILYNFFSRDDINRCIHPMFVISMKQPRIAIIRQNQTAKFTSSYFPFSSRCSDNFNDSSTHNPSGLQMQITDQRQKTAASNNPPYKVSLGCIYTHSVKKKMIYRSQTQITQTSNSDLFFFSLQITHTHTHFKPRLSSNSSHSTQTSTY